MVGLWLNTWLPENHRSAASHDAIKLGTGMISVLASLVLGLLTASIKNSFDTTDGQFRTFAANLILLDQTLRDYGPDASSARKLLRDYTARAIEDHGRRKAASACGWKTPAPGGSCTMRTWPSSICRRTIRPVRHCVAVRLF
jgi:hypothetical protein